MLFRKYRSFYDGCIMCFYCVYPCVYLNGQFLKLLSDIKPDCGAKKVGFRGHSKLNLVLWCKWTFFCKCFYFSRCFCGLKLTLTLPGCDHALMSHHLQCAWLFIKVRKTQLLLYCTCSLHILKPLGLVWYHLVLRCENHTLQPNRLARVTVVYSVAARLMLSFRSSHHSDVCFDPQSQNS